MRAAAYALNRRVPAIGSVGCSEQPIAQNLQMGGGKGFKRLLVGEIYLFEREAVAMRFSEPLEARALQRRIVIIIEIVDPDDLLAAIHQLQRCRRSDEAGDAGNEYAHARPASRA